MSDAELQNVTEGNADDDPSDRNDLQHKGEIVVLRETTAAGGSSRLTAYIDGDEHLVLEGYDRGDTVQAVWGDSDYEYWRTVKREHLDKVLLHLLKERFASDVEFHEWLKKLGIPDEFQQLGLGYRARHRRQ
ncbi:MAG: hypothetical protein H0V76_11645 [Blastocatellia bacterium]|nr:hypothetical protein [Blastocatellia bacterium]